jgi:hypothetical protein
MYPVTRCKFSGPRDGPSGHGSAPVDAVQCGELVTEEVVSLRGMSPQERRRIERQAYTFYLDAGLVDRARQEIDEGDVIRSIEAALAAAIDYQLWVREVRAGARDVLS